MQNICFCYTNNIIESIITTFIIIYYFIADIDSFKLLNHVLLFLHLTVTKPVILG